VAELVLGRYRMLERLGSGGFGVVWRARDELLGREVAVKRIPLAPDGDSERATREALATARLAHPSIVALYEAQSDHEAFYLISELVHGETLSQLIAAEALADEEVIAIGVALARALSHAHDRGVIHRDVKPQNVLVPNTFDDRAPEHQPLAVAKLTDFGGASLVDQEALTRTGDVLGTLAYMAPEQSEGRDVGEETDLYALALVLYEALSGVNPVRGATPAATARRIGRPLPALERSRRDLPRELTRALDAALAPEPEDRGTIEELRLALEETLQRGLGRSRTRRSGSRTRRQPRTDAEPPLARARHAEAAAANGLAARPAAGAPRAATRSEAELEAVGEPDGPSRPGRLALPRGLWLGLALAAIVWQASRCWRSPQPHRSWRCRGGPDPAGWRACSRRSSVSWASRAPSLRWPDRLPAGASALRSGHSATGGSCSPSRSSDGACGLVRRRAPPPARPGRARLARPRTCSRRCSLPACCSVWRSGPAARSCSR
jgi:hypothetical protein